MPMKKVRGKHAALEMGTRTQQERLLSRLERAIGASVNLTITDNSHTLISSKHQAGNYSVRLHAMFLNAEPAVVKALAIYIKNVAGHQECRQANKALDDYIAHNDFAIHQLPPQEHSSRVRLVSQGWHYDLKTVLQEVVDIMKDSGLYLNVGGVAIGWSWPRTVTLPRRSIKLGSYNADNWAIVVHPALDSPVVPRCFIQQVVYHELLHHRLRRGLIRHEPVVHTDEFKRLERRFPLFQIAAQWERKNLNWLLRRNTKPRRRG